MKVIGNGWVKHKQNVARVGAVVLAVYTEEERDLKAAALSMRLNRTFTLSFSSSAMCIGDGDRSGRALISDGRHNLTFSRVHWYTVHISCCSGKQNWAYFKYRDCIRTVSRHTSLISQPSWHWAGKC